MGMTKALQERVFIQANIRCPSTRFLCVRYGNVLASRGSVIPFFHDQIRNGGPVTITTEDMTRFLLSLNDAVDVIFAAVRDGLAGETYIPRVPSALVTHIARALIGDRPIETRIAGIRPGEKIHEILVSEEEAYRTVERGAYYAILPMLPELRGAGKEPTCLTKEYSSADKVMNFGRNSPSSSEPQTNAGRQIRRISRGAPLKIMTILGTRPEIIRLSLVIKLLDQYSEHILVDTGSETSDATSERAIFSRARLCANRIFSLDVEELQFWRPDGANLCLALSHFYFF